MRGGSVKRIIFLLCGILAASLCFVQIIFAKSKIKQSAKTTLVIGDSIAYGMALGKKYETGVDEADKVYWLTEGGININFLHPDFKIHMGKVMPKRIVNTLTASKNFDLIKEIKKKKVEDIVIILGANWPGEKSAKLIVNCLKKLVKKSGCRVYYVNILPYVHKGRYKNRVSVMTYHNKLTKEGFKDTDIIYIDAYGITKSVRGYQNCTWDGIHYSKKVYNVIFKEVLASVEKARRIEKTARKQKNGKLKNKLENKD